MIEFDGGAGSLAPRHFKAESRKSLGSSLFTIQIYEIVLDAGEDGITTRRIHDKIKGEPAFRTDTAAWWEKIRSSSPADVSFNVDHAGYQRVRQRVNQMHDRDILVSLGPGGRKGSSYVAGRKPNGFRSKPKPLGWVPVDVKAARHASERQRDRIALIQQAKTELAKEKPRAAKLGPLLAEAVRLLEAREA